MNPKFSIVIPVRNEEYYLPICLAAIKKAARNYSYEVIAVINRSSDQSEAIAIKENCLIVYTEGNLSQIRNAGAKQASGEIIITVDADSQVSENMFVEIDHTFKSKKYIGGGVLILPDRWSLGIFLTALALTPIALFYGVSGGLFFVDKTSFFELNGFDETVNSAEDIDFAKRLKSYAKTKKLKFKNLLKAHIITSTRKFDHFGDWYFLKHPIMCWKLLKNQDKEAANTIWYNFSKRN